MVLRRSWSKRFYYIHTLPHNILKENHVSGSGNTLEETLRFPLSDIWCFFLYLFPTQLFFFFFFALWWCPKCEFSKALRVIIGYTFKLDRQVTNNSVCYQQENNHNHLLCFSLTFFPLSLRQFKVPSVAVPLWPSTIPLCNGKTTKTWQIGVCGYHVGCPSPASTTIQQNGNTNRSQQARMLVTETHTGVWSAMQARKEK